MEAAGHSLRGTVMDLSWTCRPPAVNPCGGSRTRPLVLTWVSMRLAR